MSLHAMLRRQPWPARSAAAATALRRDERSIPARGVAPPRPAAAGFDFSHIAIRRSQAPRGEGGDPLPGPLRSEIERRSGLSLDEVRVHYRSAQPARLAALAFTRGSEIHLAPGQERHLPHEAWHAVQQKQGRVRPTLRGGGAEINADPGLEREADRMGSGAATVASPAHRPGEAAPAVVQRVVDLRQHFGKDLSNETLGRLSHMQQVLADPEAAFSALNVLEGRAKSLKDENNKLSSNQALNLALQETESTWMSSGRIKVTGDNKLQRQMAKQLHPETGVVAKSSTPEFAPETLGGGGTLPPETFVSKALTPLKPLKDVGAGPHHGEHAHRLQWYILHHHLNQQFNQERSEKDGKSELRHLYHMMANPNRVIDHPLGLKEKDESPVRISLWDAVLDARGEWSAGKHAGKEHEGVAETYGDVGFGAPALLTSVLTDRSKTANKAKVLGNYDTALEGMGLGKQASWANELPTLADAVTKRKLKRMGI